MDSAVSQASADATTVAEAVPATYHWFKMPDLNRATHRRLGQSGAGWTFETIRKLVHHVSRVGRPKARKAARELGRLGVGLQAIADEAGHSVGKVRRDLVELAKIGLVAVVRQNVTFTVDPATGRIKENRTGRSVPVVVYLTIGPEHLRTKAGRDRAANPSNPAPANPATVEGLGLHDRDHSGGGIQRERKTERTPDGDAVGIGTPPAAEDAGLPAGGCQASQGSDTTGNGLPEASQGRLPAAKAPGHSAGKASQEGRHVRLDEPDDGLPPRVGSLPAGKAPRRERRRQADDDPRAPNVWDGHAEECRRRMMAELEERRRREAAEIEAAKAAGEATPRQRAMA